jgi:hypothetical protein
MRSLTLTRKQGQMMSERRARAMMMMRSLTLTRKQGQMMSERRVKRNETTG